MIETNEVQQIRLRIAELKAFSEYSFSFEMVGSCGIPEFEI